MIPQSTLRIEEPAVATAASMRHCILTNILAFEISEIFRVGGPSFSCILTTRWLSNNKHWISIPFQKVLSTWLPARQKTSRDYPHQVSQNLQLTSREPTRAPVLLSSVRWLVVCASPLKLFTYWKQWSPELSAQMWRQNIYWQLLQKAVIRSPTSQVLETGQRGPVFLQYLLHSAK
jgi:hypothetical protein